MAGIMRYEIRREFAEKLISVTLEQYSKELEQMDYDYFYKKKVLNSTEVNLIKDGQNAAFSEAMLHLTTDNWLDRLNHTGIEELFDKCQEIAFRMYLDCRLDYPDSGKISIINDDDTNTVEDNNWRINIDSNNKIVNIKYGKADNVEIIQNNTVLHIFNLLSYKGGLSSKFSEIYASCKYGNKYDPLAIEDILLNSGIYFFWYKDDNGSNLKEWLPKEDYIKTKSDEEFSNIDLEKTQVTVTAEYKKGTNKLKFYYQIQGKSKKLLFDFLASNNQKNREFPTRDNTNDPTHEILYTCTSPKHPYIPQPFPSGTWKIQTFDTINDPLYGHYIFRTNATQKVEIWEKAEKETVLKNGEKKKIIFLQKAKDSNGNQLYVIDSGYQIHGGGYKNETDSLRSNQYIKNTEGCIRLQNIDTEIIYNTLLSYKNKYKYIALEVQ